MAGYGYMDSASSDNDIIYLVYFCPNYYGE